MKFVLLINTYSQTHHFRHYLLSARDKGFSDVSLRCHRRRHYWQSLTRRFITLAGITISIWEWTTFDEQCSPGQMKKDCKSADMELSISKWSRLQPHHTEGVSLLLPAEEKLPAL